MSHPKPTPEPSSKPNDDISAEHSADGDAAHHSLDSVGVQQSVKLPSEEALMRRFHIVTGKGGVGKSVVALTLGLTFAKRGLKTLICELDHREMMTRSFGRAPSRSALRPLTDYLTAVSIETHAALGEYGLLKLKVRALSHLLTENPLTRALVAVIPGVADLIALGKAFNHERERNAAGPIWDRVIVDAPSTGHGLTFMRLPQLIREVVPSGNMRREADEMWSLIADPHRTAVHVVTTPDEMPVQETVELWSSLRDHVGVTPSSLWVNALPPLPFSPAVVDLTELESRAAEQRDASEVRGEALSYLCRRQREGLAQHEQLKRLSSIQSSFASLPRFSAQQPEELRRAIERSLRVQD